MTLSSAFFAAWSIMVCEVAFRLGMVIMPPYGAMPFPLDLMTKRDRENLLTTDVLLFLAFSLYGKLSPSTCSYGYDINFYLARTRCCQSGMFLIYMNRRH